MEKSMKRYFETTNHETTIHLKSIAIDAIIALVAAILLLGSWSVVPEGSRGVRTRFSEAVSQTNQGLQFKIPLIESIHPVSVMADAVAAKDAEGSTSDTQPVHTTFVVRFHIRENAVLNVYKEYSRTGDIDNFVTTTSYEAFKAVTAKYKADELISKRAEVSQGVLSVIQSRVEKYGALVLNVDMTNFSFAPDYMKAISSKVTEEQQKLAELNKLERLKVENQQEVVKANATAEATVATAKAQAEAIRVQSKALAESPQFLELRRLDVEMAKAGRWNGILPTHVLGGVTPFMDISKVK
jgi:prohibitin 2